MTADRISLVETRGLTKSFAGIEVLRNIDFDVRSGEIHALLGENGAGKSTFVKMLAGVVRPSRGEICIGGQPVGISSPLEAQRLGIMLIHQEPISFPDLSVAENIAAGRGTGRLLGWVNWAKIEAEARRLMELLGVDIDVSQPMRGLSIADQQMVEIARALADDSRLIIMDEPTAALTPQEAGTLFSIVRRLRDEGRTFLFISHRLEEVRALCDRATIFRDGELIATKTMADLSDADIIQLMVGRPLNEYFHSRDHRPGAVALELEGLSSDGHFSDITFAIKYGEIVGLAGLVGAGRTAVAMALFGLISSSGHLKKDGVDVRIRRPSDAIGLGIGFVSEDRAASGIFGALSVMENITAAIPDRIAPHGLIRRRLEEAIAKGAIAALDIRASSMRQPIGELSGGNQQKAILARWLLTDPRILIIDEPTRGIDIGVRTDFYDRIGALAAEGCAILLISSDLPELLALSDTIVVMSEGRVTAQFARGDATQDRIMEAAVPRANSDRNTQGSLV